jgi:hypothetical protein
MNFFYSRDLEGFLGTNSPGFKSIEAAHNKIDCRRIKPQVNLANTIISQNLKHWDLNVAFESGVSYKNGKNRPSGSDQSFVSSSGRNQIAVYLSLKNGLQRYNLSQELDPWIIVHVSDRLPFVRSISSPRMSLSQTFAQSALEVAEQGNQNLLFLQHKVCLH